MQLQVSTKNPLSGTACKYFFVGLDLLILTDVLFADEAVRYS